MSETRDDALLKLTPPSRRRPTVREGILQINIVSSACELQCVNCSQGSGLRAKRAMMTPDQFHIACQSLEGYWGLPALFGGNPAVSPYFEEICDIFCTYFGRDQRGLWCNSPRGHGKKMREVFRPDLCNLNTHMVPEARAEFIRDWPESKPFLKGGDVDSRHGPTLVAMKDVVEDEDERWRLIGDCEISRFWSGMLCVVHGEVKGFHCEIGGAMAMLHQDDPDWPDLGVPATPGWWNNNMFYFEDQAAFYCHRCSVPLKGHGGLAMSGVGEQVSQTHAHVYKPKDRQRLVELVTSIDQLGDRQDRATTYLPTEPRYTND